jgi:DNA polymerase III subunit gamma/tau
MSYLVLARKWRPQSFEDLIGQEHVSQTLANAIRTGRIHHAFLFTGARGVGKTSAARIFAKALNCETGITSEPCNQCSSCLEITQGQGVDVFEIDGASNTGVDDIRDLRENIRYLPARSRYKIFIIDEVHMLSINAFNALLKTLEEPPAHAKFIFATTEPHKIPVTILSRCQRFDFRKIVQSRIVERLDFIARAENLEISERALALVARRGEGSMRDALSTLDQVIAFCGETIKDEDVQGLLGMVDRRLLMDVVEALHERNVRRALEAVRRVDELGYSFRQFCQELVEFYRSLILCKVLTEPEDLLQFEGSELPELQRIAGPVELADLQRNQTVLMKTEADLAATTFPRLTLEMVLVRLAELPPMCEVSSLVRKIEGLERRLEATTLVSASPAETVAKEEQRPPKKSEAPASSGTTGGGWLGLVNLVRSQRPMLSSILEHGSLLKQALPHLELGFPAGSFHLDQVRDAETLELLTGMASDYFGQPVTIRIVALDAKAGQVPPSLLEEQETQESDRKKRLREDALAHPLVQQAIALFEGEIREVRPIDKGYV